MDMCYGIRLSSRSCCELDRLPSLLVALQRCIAVWTVGGQVVFAVLDRSCAAWLGYYPAQLRLASRLMAFLRYLTLGPFPVVSSTNNRLASPSPLLFIPPTFQKRFYWFILLCPLFLSRSNYLKTCYCLPVVLPTLLFLFFFFFFPLLLIIIPPILFPSTFPVVLVPFAFLYNRFWEDTSKVSSNTTKKKISTESGVLCEQVVIKSLFAK